MSPTQRTLSTLRAHGWTVQVVERWQSFFGRKGGGPPGVRVDLFGCIDILALREGDHALLAVQACRDADLSARSKKAAAQPALRLWLEAGCRFEVWGWRKHGSRWMARIRRFTLCAGNPEAPNPDQLLNFSTPKRPARPTESKPDRKPTKNPAQ